jgi:hypothetical protein
VVFNGELIAAGQFSSAGGAPAHNIAAWNGAVWRPLGAGLDGALPANLPVHALCVFQDALIAGGSFRSSGSTPITSVARWDGAAWAPLGPDPPSGLYFVRALGIYQGRLVIGGSSIRAFWHGQSLGDVVLWDGAVWSGLPPIGAQNVRSFAAYRGRLYAGGELWGFGAFSGGSAVFDGKVWVPLGLTLGPNPLDNGPFGLVDAMLEHDGDLHVAGWFTMAAGRVSAGIAHWGCPCYANCDGSAAPQALNVGDFVCFTQQYAAGSDYANCDHSTAPPVLNVNDFVCFQERFLAGCP